MLLSSSQLTGVYVLIENMLFKSAIKYKEKNVLNVLETFERQSDREIYPDAHNK